MPDHRPPGHTGRVLVRRTHQLALIEEQLDKALANPRGWETVKYRFPYLRFTLTEASTRKKFRIRLDLAEYDLQPPRVAIVHPVTGLEVSRRYWPQQSNFTERTNHHDTDKPWCCTVGTREFHDHFHHKHVSWDSRRNYMDLEAILCNLADNISKPRPVVRAFS